jgi:hypothetical protein
MAGKFQPRSEGVNVTSDLPPTLHILLKKTLPKNNIVVGDDRAPVGTALDNMWYTWQIDYRKLLLHEVGLFLLFAAAYCIVTAIYQSVIDSRTRKP